MINIKETHWNLRYRSVLLLCLWRSLCLFKQCAEP